MTAHWHFGVTLPPYGERRYCITVWSRKIHQKKSLFLHIYVRHINSPRLALRSEWVYYRQCIKPVLINSGDDTRVLERDIGNKLVFF